MTNKALGVRRRTAAATPRPGSSIKRSMPIKRNRNDDISEEIPDFGALAALEPLETQDELEFAAIQSPKFTSKSRIPKFPLSRTTAQTPNRNYEDRENDIANYPISRTNASSSHLGCDGFVNDLLPLDEKEIFEAQDYQALETPLKLQNSETPNTDRDNNFQESCKAQIRHHSECGPMDPPVRNTTPLSPNDAAQVADIQDDPSLLCFAPTPKVSQDDWCDEVRLITSESTDEIGEAPHGSALAKRIDEDLYDLTQAPVNPFDAEPLSHPQSNFRLPLALNRLHALFKSLVLVATSLRSSPNKINKILLDSRMMAKIQNLANAKNTELPDFQRMCWLSPKILELCRDPSDNLLLHIKPVGNHSSPASECEAKRNLFRSALVEWTKRHHNLFLISLNPPIEPPPIEKLKDWHLDFNLEAVAALPGVTLPEKRIPTRTSCSTSPFRQSETSSSALKAITKKLPRAPHSYSQNPPQSDFSQDSESPVKIDTPGMQRLRSRAKSLSTAKSIEDQLIQCENTAFSNLKKQQDLILMLELLQEHFFRQPGFRMALLSSVAKRLSDAIKRPDTTPSVVETYLKEIAKMEQPIVKLMPSVTIKGQLMLVYNQSRVRFSHLVDNLKAQLGKSTEIAAKCRANRAKTLKARWSESARNDDETTTGQELEQWANLPSPFKI